MNRRKKLELTPRLQVLADWVLPDSRIVDVGTDHGYLPIWLLQNGVVSSAIASDLRKGPLSRAKQDAIAYGVEQQLDCRLCNGLMGIEADEADTVIIAGMGGETIVEILRQAPWTADGCHRLLLQPMTKAEALRTFLEENSYQIQKEKLVWDRGTIYPVLLVCAGQMKLTMGQRYCGAALVQDPLQDRYLIERIIRMQNAIYGLRHSTRREDQEKREHLRQVMTELFSMREEWRNANGSRD